MDQQHLPFNRLIDGLIVNSTWHIDPLWGMAQLHQYVAEVETAAMLGRQALAYSERREALMSQVITLDGAAFGLPEFSGQDGVAVLRMNGVMRSEDGLSSQGIRSLVSDMDKAFSHPGIKGVVLDINSGGGEMVAGSMMKSTLTNAPKPVVALAHMMASAALYATLPVEHIMVADPNAVIGSIGVMYSLNRKMRDWYSQNYEDIYSATSPDKNREWRQYLLGDASQFIEKATTYDAVFMDEVRRLRPGLKNPDQILRGDTFTGRLALESGLATHTGNLRDAVQLVHQLAGSAANINNINHTTMDFKTIGAQFSRIFGPAAAAAAAATTEEELIAALQGIEPVGDLATRVAVLEGRDHGTTIAGLQDEIKVLQATIAQHATTIDGLNTALNTTKADLAKTQKDLVDAQAAGVGAKTTETQVPGASIPSTDQAVGIVFGDTQVSDTSKY